MICVSSAVAVGLPMPKSAQVTLTVPPPEGTSTTYVGTTHSEYLAVSLV